MTATPPPPKRPKPFVSIDPRWWSLGVVDAFQKRAQRPGVVDGFSYTSGRVEGEAARLQGVPVDTVLAKYKVPYREADFRPLPPLLPSVGGLPKDSP
jgi:hypothetical protein